MTHDQNAGIKLVSSGSLVLANDIIHLCDGQSSDVMLFALADVLAGLLAEHPADAFEALLAVHGQAVRDLVVVNRERFEHWQKTNGDDPRGLEPSES